MIHILIDNSTYPYAQVAGVYKDYRSALKAKGDLDRPLTENDEIQIVSWDIINNCVVTFDGNDGGTALSAAA